jgi:phenylpropionate dioxygenase-like ring-hydroxylating dioxygenase large terminal subunit
MLTNIAAGHAAAFICPYHGWRYERDGQLTSITAKECFPGVDRAVQGLLELPLRICEGLIFVSIAPDADFNARNWLGPIADLLRGFKLATHQHFRTEVIETAFNWKIGVEGSLETYHFRPLHAESIARIFDGMATVYDHWAPHQRQCVAKPSLLAANDPAGPVALLRAQILQTYFVFPCTLVSITNDHMLLTFFYPRGVTGCTMVYTLLTPAEMSGEAHAKHWERTWQLTRSVLSEDFEVQEGIQRAAEHANDAQLTLGLFEQGLARFHQAIDASGIPPTC